MTYETAQSEYDTLKRLFEPSRIKMNGETREDLISLLGYANDNMVHPSAFCALMAYCAEALPEIAPEALELRKGCVAANVPAIGARIMLKAAVDRFPDFLAPSGATGTVNYINGDVSLIGVLMDVMLPGAEGWNNNIQFYDHDTREINMSAIGDFLESCDVLPAAPAPTARPWQHDGHGMIYGQAGEDESEAPFVADVCRDEMDAALTGPTPQEKANAEYMTHCVNQFETMLSALEAIPGSCEHSYPHLMACWVCKRDDAIAKAKMKGA